MIDRVIYKVLWVDDQEEIVESTKTDADAFGIELDHYTNWQEAEVALRNNFDDYTAIILDAYCKIESTEDIKDVFIGAVLPKLHIVFGEKKKSIPWYILSAGTMNDFSRTIELAEYQKRHEEWGPMLYLKDAPDDDPKSSYVLYKNIRNVGKEKTNNIILFRHLDVFSYLGRDKLIDERARKLMLKMLGALYAPEENLKYDYAGNPLRKVLEYVFRAARKIGVLSDDCFGKNDHIVLQRASMYLAGMNIEFREGEEVTLKIRWGKPGKNKDGTGGDCVLASDSAMMVKNIINYSSSDSHTTEKEQYLIDEQNKELFFGYVMQLCYIIKCFGKYADEHPNVEENKKMQQVYIPKETTKSDDIKNK